MTAALARFAGTRIFWPIVLLVVLLVINLIAFPGFFTITIQNGHLFGSLIDILRNGAPTLIIAVGMTLVIATRGIDLSVGAVCAISGAVAAAIILGSPDPGNPGVVAVAVGVSLGISLVLADAFLEKFSGDSLNEIHGNYATSTDRLQARFRRTAGEAPRGGGPAAPKR